MKLVLMIIGLSCLLGSSLSQGATVEFNLDGGLQGYSEEEKLWRNVGFSTFVYPKTSWPIAVGLRYIMGQYERFHLDIGARVGKVDNLVFGNLYVKVYEDWGLIGAIAEAFVGEMSTLRIEGDVGVKVARYKQAYLFLGGGLGLFSISFDRKKNPINPLGKKSPKIAEAEETETETTNHLTYSLKVGGGVYLGK